MARNPKWFRDELILALDLYMRTRPRLPKKTSKEVLELSALLRDLPIYPPDVRDLNFRNADGVTMKLANFLTLDPDDPREGLKAGSKLDQEIWLEFATDNKLLSQTARNIRTGYKSVELPNSLIKEENELYEAKEGKILYKLHRLKERDIKIVQKKKSDVLKKFKKLSCEVCDFNFAEVYGELGEGFAECHHRVPLANLQGETSIKLSDLAIVCANCHRMLHKGTDWKSVEELRILVRAKRGK